MGGYELNNNAINRHRSQETHVHVLNERKKVKLRILESKLEELKTEDPVNRITNHHMMACYTAAKIGVSFTQHISHIHMFESRHIDMGEHCKNRFAARRMIQVILTKKSHTF